MQRAVPHASLKRLTFNPIMLKELVTPMKPHEVHRVDHRNGSGHLDPAYETALRLRVRDRARKTGDRAFVSAASRAEPGAEESGEKFVTAVTCGGDGEELPYPEETSEERGGPFVKTYASVEFAYDTDDSNPITATREPFPTS
jgi:hypothetical protein